MALFVNESAVAPCHEQLRGILSDHFPQFVVVLVNEGDHKAEPAALSEGEEVVKVFLLLFVKKYIFAA